MKPTRSKWEAAPAGMLTARQFVDEIASRLRTAMKPLAVRSCEGLRPTSMAKWKVLAAQLEACLGVASSAAMKHRLSFPRRVGLYWNTRLRSTRPDQRRDQPQQPQNHITGEGLLLCGLRHKSPPDVSGHLPDPGGQAAQRRREHGDRRVERRLHRRDAAPHPKCSGRRTGSCSPTRSTSVASW